MSRLVIISVVLALSGSQWVWAKGMPDDVRERMVSMRDQAEQLRSQNDQSYEQQKWQCYKAFFVNHCLDKAREQHLQTELKVRQQLIAARNIELADRQRRAQEGEQPGEKILTPEQAQDLRNKRQQQLEQAQKVQQQEQKDDTVMTPEQAQRERARRAAFEKQQEAQSLQQQRQDDANQHQKQIKEQQEANDRMLKSREDKQRYDKKIKNYEEKQQQTQ